MEGRCDRCGVSNVEVKTVIEDNQKMTYVISAGPQMARTHTNPYFGFL